MPPTRTVDPARTRLTLAMIVKNEAETLPDTLSSAAAVLGPAMATLVVQDTGSADDTIRKVQEWGLAQGPDGPGVVILQREWEDFSTNRNACLDVAFSVGRPVLMLDAGAILRGVWNGLAPATVECALGELRYPRPQVLVPGYRYEGKVHECVIGPELDRLPSSGLVVDYCLRDTARSVRWVRDLALLEGDMSPRGRFYYAQTLELLGRKAQALSAYVDRAANYGGYWQERVVAYIRAARLAPDRDQCEDLVRSALQLDDSRGEAWLALAPWAERRQDWAWLYTIGTRALAAVPREGALFSEHDREWKAHVYCSEASWHRGDAATCEWHLTRALTHRLPADVFENARSVLAKIARGEIPKRTVRIGGSS